MGRDGQPQTYQEKAKVREFFEFLSRQGLHTSRKLEDVSRQVDSQDAARVVGLLHPGVRLLLSTSARQNRVLARMQLERLLTLQARAFLSGYMQEVNRFHEEIEQILNKEKEITSTSSSSESMEIDLYIHGWSDDGEITPVLHSTTTNSSGIEASVIPMHMKTPEQRTSVSTSRPQKVTPYAEGDSNVVNVGELAAKGGNLVKKVAQLERAATYARVRANEYSGDVLQVVGYAALGMSLIDGSEIAATIISLHAELFPTLFSLQEKGALAYLLSQRGVYEDVEKLIGNNDKLTDEVQQCKAEVQECKAAIKKCKQEIKKCKQEITRTIMFACLGLAALIVLKPHVSFGVHMK